MTTFLLILLIIWGGWKLLRWWLMRSLAKRSRDLFEQFARQAGAQTPHGAEARQTDPRRRNKSGWDQPQRKKKINKSEGEYIDYEEVVITETETTVNTTDSNATRTSTTFTQTEITEERITDAEWEDLPS